VVNSVVGGKLKYGMVVTPWTEKEKARIQRLIYEIVAKDYPKSFPREIFSMGGEGWEVDNVWELDETQIIGLICGLERTGTDMELQTRKVLDQRMKEIYREGVWNDQGHWKAMGGVIGGKVQGIMGKIIKVCNSRGVEFTERRERGRTSILEVNRLDKRDFFRKGMYTFEDIRERMRGNDLRREIIEEEIEQSITNAGWRELVERWEMDRRDSNRGDGGTLGSNGQRGDMEGGRGGGVAVVDRTLGQKSGEDDRGRL